jgi:signal transduction histidine kinase
MLGTSAGRAVNGGSAIATYVRAAVTSRIAIRDQLQLAVWVLFPAAALSAAWWTLQSSSIFMPEVRAAYLVYSIAVPSVIGLLWWRWRPASGVGPLLVALGLSAWFLSWQAASEPAVIALGVASTGLVAFEICYLCMSFPTGRLSTRFERWVALGIGIALASAWLPVLLAPDDSIKLTLCSPGCQPNLVDVNSGSAVATRQFALSVVNVVVAAAVLAVVAARFFRASAPRRRASLVVLGVAAFFLISWIAAYAARLGSPLDVNLVAQTSSLQLVARVVLPLGFLAALLRAEYYAAGAIRRLVDGLGSGVSMGQLRAVLVAAVGDPDLRIGVWDGQLRRYVDSDGSTFSWPSAGSGRAVLPISRNGQPVAAIVADEAVVAEPELRDAAATATVLAIDELQIENELMVLRAKAVAATDAERMRIVRDLHDSAQQQLVALRVRVALLAGSSAEFEGKRAMTDRLAAELDGSIAELRALTRRFLAPSSIAAGIAPALRMLTTAWPVAITVHDRGLQRYDDEIEKTVFSCCVDAIGNAVEHGGQDVRVSVRLFEKNGYLRFVVRDNGRGFDPADIPSGSGLTTMHDRVVLANGCLSVISARGRGAVVVGTIPVSRESD